MEEEVGIKVTRLRRRLSVESDDVKSPSTQSTPTKKRGGRLAAKPQLELIDENATDTAPKRTRKTTVKDVAEPIEEKVVTPSRRSTRIRSNTSIVSETPEVAEDKGTPSRRSTRIKSNTSLIADTVNVNSPRAKRAARRTSLAGSDNETPVTPARQTRRTRKDSNSSVDKQAEPVAGKLGGQLNEVIVEETENSGKDTNKSDTLKPETTPVRKSPRLVGKPDRKSSPLENEDKENEPQSDKTESDKLNKSATEINENQTNESADEKNTEINNLSISTTNLLSKIDEVPKKGKLIMNKSTTSIDEPTIKSKRNRTKSWTTISVEASNDHSFCSDSEASKKKNKRNNILNVSNITGSGDGIMNMTNKNDQENQDYQPSLNSSVSNQKKKKRNEQSMSVDTETSVRDGSILNSSNQLNKSATQISDHKQVSKNDHEESENNTSKKQENIIEKLFQQTPSGQTTIFIEDSDSNNGSVGKDKKETDSEDQCVPVVNHNLEDESSNEPKNNISYEPMDIDETMPENISLSTFIDKNDSGKQEDQRTEIEKRKSTFNVSQNNESLNKSKRKSKTFGMNLDDTSSENNKSQRKSSLTATNDFEDNNKSKRKSSVSSAASEDVTDGVSNISNCKSLKNTNNDISMDKKTNKSKRNSSISLIQSEENTEEDSKTSVDPVTNSDDLSNKSSKKASISKLEDLMENSLNKSKRKSSVSAMVTEISMDEKNGSILETCDDDNDNDVNKSTNKSKNKSSILKIVNDSMDSKTNKSKRKSSVSFVESQSLDKSENENKSTLVLSQIKDATENEIYVETNVPKTNETSEQLSKSVDVPNVVEKETDKKNLSLTYSTSTPLQQKSIKKLGLQINSSIIAPNSVSKLEKKNTPNKSKKEASVLSQKDSSDSSDDDESEEESSAENSKLIIDEAEEASEDYESGDSRDEDEREYEEQNEIVEKGETLDSDDDEDYSDDSDYEKGSFIVSSDNEDNELLTGSGDDLSMSADELTMSSKSKKKYNERKLKEQKKASREMFEARHKLNESDKSAKFDKIKNKKNNRQRLESSSDSDDEVVTQTKKNRRQRIDSSQDASNIKSDADESITKKKKKKAKRLSESVCADNEANEIEMTMCEETDTDKIDPLSLKNVIKEEPKTPQKDLNISTVAITNVEEVNVNEDVSMMKSNQTSDPLQVTEDQDDENDEDVDSISENEEITQNYESVLNDLNKANTKKIKNADISLNLEKKAKKSKEPIVDQLNLTQVKEKKKKKERASESIAESKKDKSYDNKSTDKDKQVNEFSEDSSDSIDMKLLFPEDSNDSEAVTTKASENNQTLEQNEKVEGQSGAEDFIPLKRTEGKTNMLENIDTSNTSLKEKKNKRKTIEADENLTMNDQIFFVDTTGSLPADKSDSNISIKNSAKKNKQKNNISFVNTEEVNDDDAPLEVSYRSEKNKSKQDLNVTEIQDNRDTQTENTETPNQSGKKNKKNKKDLNNSLNVLNQSTVDADDIKEKSINISATIGSSSKKKKVLESHTEEVTETDVPLHSAQNVSIGSGKKKNTASESSAVEKGVEHKSDKDVVNNEVISKKRKRKSSANQTIEELINNDEVKPSTSQTIESKPTIINQKKKRKISHNDEDVQAQIQVTDTEKQAQEKDSVKNPKKKVKVPQIQEINEINEVPANKNKKRKEREDDDASKISKILKQNSFDKVHVPRLPANLLKQLDDKPIAVSSAVNKANIVSTTSFVVEETKKRKSKPSNYLEESVYLNDDFVERKPKSSLKKPKVLPFVPTASTSDKGFTTKFTVNIIPQETQFIAQSTTSANFKNDYLHKKRIKKLGTFELYKRQRNIKISKF